jgi:peptidyl-tRNA hydrolase, PTH1 family
MKYLIVGIGNIGEEYAHSRHNIGFDVVDAFAQKHEGIFTPGRLAEVAECKWKGKLFILIKPVTFVNLSGKAVKYWIDKEKIAVHNMLVVVDDLALPLEVLRLRPAGSDAGHNGLKSIQEALGTSDYPKLRFGIGSNFPKGRQVEFVLGQWLPHELPVVNKKIELAITAIEGFASIGIQRTMSDINRKEISL